MRIDAQQMAYFLHPTIDASSLAATTAQQEATAKTNGDGTAADGDGDKAPATATVLPAISTTPLVPAVKAHEIYSSPRSSAILPLSPTAKGLAKPMPHPSTPPMMKIKDAAAAAVMRWDSDCRVQLTRYVVMAPIHNIMLF